MLKYLLTIVLLFLNLFVFSQKITVLKSENKIKINSKYLNEKTEIWVNLPEDFEKKKDSCSILILLDGDEYFGMAKDIQRLYQFDEKMPATIVVGIPSTIENRWKYYTPTNSENISGNSENDELFKNSGNFSKFADFVNFEIIQFLEKKYKLKFFSKTIFGHSLGGLAVMSFYNLKPEIFNNYICASPSLLWNKFMFNDYYKNIYSSESIEYRKIFFTSGSPDINGYKKSIENLFNTLKIKIQNSENYVKYKNYENEDHGTSGLRSLLDGIEFVYSK